MGGKVCFTLSLVALAAVSAIGQTSDNLAAKYPTVSAFQVRPGILMTAKYAEDGQVCQLVLERRYTPDQSDAESSIPGKVEDQLLDELVPTVERGPATSRWLGNSYVAGGVTHTERDFENVLIEIDGTVLSGDKILVIHWKKRTCATTKVKSRDSARVSPATH
jgi:uncharacterized protein (DUF433 family)